MPASFEFLVSEYTVGLAWSSEINDFRSISIVGAGPTWSRISGTVYFFPNAREDLPGGRIGYFSSPRYLYARLNPRDFDAFYAILRSEYPVFLRGGGSDDKIEYMELHSNSEPVGEVDGSPRGRIVVGTGDVLSELDAISRP
jgi:hypothetical protein